MIVGIDPGASGAIAWLSDNGLLIEVRDLPVQKVGSRTELLPAAFAAMLREPNRLPGHVFLERVATRPGEGSAASFSFGMGFGMLQGVLASLGVPVTLVTPAKWKGNLHVPADKGAARLRACQLWPGAADAFKRVKDDGRAEAAMIGLYGFGVLHGVGRVAA